MGMPKIYLYIDTGHSVFLNPEIILNIYFLLYVIRLSTSAEKNNTKRETWNDVFSTLPRTPTFVVQFSLFADLDLHKKIFTLFYIFKVIKIFMTSQPAIFIIYIRLASYLWHII